MKLNQLDKGILKAIQDKFPLVARPFRHLALKFVVEESEIIERVKKMKEAGLIRRIGPVYDPAKLDFKTILIALQTPEDVKNRVISFINSLGNVTHSYERDNEFNLWFTFIYKDEDELLSLKEDLSRRYKIGRILLLPSIKTYKLRTSFNG